MTDSSSSVNNPEDFEYNEEYEGEYEMESSQESMDDQQNEKLVIDSYDVVQFEKQLKTESLQQRKLAINQYMKSLYGLTVVEDVQKQLNSLFYHNIDALEDEVIAVTYFKLLKQLNDPFMIFLLGKLTKFINVDKLLPYIKAIISDFLVAKKKERVYYQSLLSSVLLQDVFSENMKQIIFRRIVKLWLQYSLKDETKVFKSFIIKLLQMMGDVGQNMIVSIVRELHTYYDNAQNYRNISIFGAATTVKKQNLQEARKYKYRKQTDFMQAKLGKSADEIQSERLASKEIYILLDLVFQSCAILNYQKVVYPLVEITFMYINYLLNYHRSFFFILKVLEVITDNISKDIFVPMQNIFMNLLVDALQPAPKKSLEFNLSKYKAKLCGQKDKVDYNLLFCVPSAFVGTSIFKEKLFAETMRVLLKYFLTTVGVVKNDENQYGFEPSLFVTLPELVGHSRIQILNIQKAVQGELNAPGYFYKWQYFNYQFAFVKSVNQMFGKIKKALDSDINLSQKLREKLSVSSLSQGNVSSVVRQYAQNILPESSWIQTDKFILEEVVEVLGQQSQLLKMYQDLIGENNELSKAKLDIGSKQTIQNVLNTEVVEEEAELSDQPQLPEEQFGYEEEDEESIDVQPDVIKELEI